MPGCVGCEKVHAQRDGRVDTTDTFNTWPVAHQHANLTVGGRVSAADLLEAAAWLHDIGYAPCLTVTGRHALNCGRYPRDVQHAEALRNPHGRLAGI